MTRLDVLQRARVPSAVRLVCSILQDAGHEAYIVGGAVRDLILGKTPSDWDVASSASPNQVIALFPKTIATGLQHGTVTAIVGRGGSRSLVEITAFRGEGAYSDSRHPDSVYFGVSLVDDLARRDFVINAIAYDPILEAIHDPLGGAVDLEQKVIRAVGNAETRFAEDGLRVMRAVRFVSTLQFFLEEATQRALSTALGPLSRVAMERVRVELLKLLSGDDAGRALELAQRSGVLATILPEVDTTGLLSALPRMESLPPDSCLRLGCLLWGLSSVTLEAVLRRLTLSNQERRRVVAMLAQVETFPNSDPEPQALREFLSRVGRGAGADCLALLRAQGCALGDPKFKAAVERTSAVLASGVALEVADLAISGGELAAGAGLRGREIGETLRILLALVLEDPRRNEEEYLVAAAREISRGSSRSGR